MPFRMLLRPADVLPFGIVRRISGEQGAVTDCLIDEIGMVKVILMDNFALRAARHDPEADVWMGLVTDYCEATNRHGLGPDRARPARAFVEARRMFAPSENLTTLGEAMTRLRWLVEACAWSACDDGTGRVTAFGAELFRIVVPDTV